MATVLQQCTTEEQRAVVRFLWAKGLLPKEIHKEMSQIYAEHCLSRMAVYNWVEKFENGRTIIDDADRSGRPVEIGTNDTLMKVEELIRGNRRITIDEIAAEINCSHGQAYKMMHDQLNFRKVCARWVPKKLSAENQQIRMGLALENLCRYHTEGEYLLSRIVTGDETWVHYFQPESKRESMQWKHPFSPVTKKFKVVPSVGKVMATVFWDRCGILLIHFQKREEHVTATTYCTVLQNLRQAIRRKRPGLLSQGLLLLHDNARPHTALASQETIRKMNWEVLPHPPYSPDLAPSDFHLFGPMKQYLRGKHFTNDGEVQHNVQHWLLQQSKEFYAEGIQKLVERWDKCINVAGDYIEK